TQSPARRAAAIPRPGVARPGHGDRSQSRGTAAHNAGNAPAPRPRSRPPAPPAAARGRPHGVLAGRRASVRRAGLSGAPAPGGDPTTGGATNWPSSAPGGLPAPEYALVGRCSLRGERRSPAGASPTAPGAALAQEPAPSPIARAPAAVS